MADDFNIGVIEASKTFHQLGLLVIDGSPSMTEECQGNITKAQAVNAAVRDMFTRFKASRFKSNFSFAVVTFDERSHPHTDITPAVHIDDNASYDPLAINGNGTNIGEGLVLARQLAEEFLGSEPEGGVPTSVVIVVMSDGECGSPDTTKATADAIKQNPRITICSTLFARIGDRDVTQAQSLLRALATDPVGGYKTVYDAATLRDFFIKSASSGAAGNVTIQ